MLWDTHMHCNFSGDSEAAPEDMIQAAIAKGLDGICFTDHQDFDYREEPGLFDLDFDAYHDSILALSRKYHDQIRIRWGVELGLQPHTTAQNLAVTQKYPLDFVIGSSHCVDGIDIYYPKFFEGQKEEAAYHRYFESILDNVRSDADFDVYGHLDYVVRYGPNKNRFYSYEAYADILDAILRELIARGKGIEINTAGFRYGLGAPNPTTDILKRYRALGGEIVTIGSDAHKPEHVAADFDRVTDILKDAGFDYFTVFTERKPEFIRL